MRYLWKFWSLTRDPAILVIDHQQKLHAERFETGTIHRYRGSGSFRKDNPDWKPAHTSSECWDQLSSDEIPWLVISSIITENEGDN